MKLHDTRILAGWITILHFGLMAFSGCGGAQAEPNAEAALEWVKKLGGTATVLTTGCSEVPGARVEANQVARITRIDLSSRPVTDKSLAEMPALEQLNYLGLYRTQVTDAGIEHLKKISSLRELELSYTNITDAGLANLVLFKDLRRLFLHGTNLSKQALDDFAKKRPDCRIIHGGT